ncbi:hypothetical protein B0H21DRAFT_143739 [Amylocystis lapponica]|nr:hypothetical protein B0H21DRAFT_143739 [Amylocystis lapponica]
MSKTFEIPATCPLVSTQMPKHSSLHECYWETPQREWEIDYNVRYQPETEQEYEHSTAMFFADTVLSPLRIDSLLLLPDLNQSKETPRIGLMLSGHSELEWTPAPQLCKQRSAYTSEHHGHQASLTSSSLSSAASLASLPQPDDTRIDAVEYEDIEADVWRWADKAMEWVPVDELIPPTPAILPSLLPDVAPAYGQMEQLATPTDTVVDGGTGGEHPETDDKGERGQPLS